MEMIGEPGLPSPYLSKVYIHDWPPLESQREQDC